MKHPAYLLLGVAGALTLVSAMLAVARAPHQPAGMAGLSWRQRFVAGNRRHRPRTRAIQLACLAVALALYLGYFVTLFG